MARVFKQYIPFSFVALALLESAGLFFSVYAGVAIWQTAFTGFVAESLTPLYWKAIVYLLLVNLSLIAMGLYQRRFRYGMAGIVLRICSAFILAAVAISLVFYLIPALFLDRGPLIVALLIAFVLVSAVRIGFLKTVDQSILKRRILVLGAGERASQISKNLRRATDQREFTIVGYVHVRGEHDVVDENLIVRPDVPLLTLATQLQVDEIVVAVGERRRRSFPVHELLDCKLSGIDVIDLLQFFEREVGKIKLDILNPSWLIFSDGFNQSEVQAWIKRVFDVVMALSLFLVAWPAMILVALAILIEGKGKGPIFYKQVRVGQHWKLFSVIKFRSMRVDAEKDGAQWAQKKDSRVTVVGEFIRKVRLDELPQIFNVLKGDMSFVGPRPERPEFVTDLTEKIPYFAERHRVKPGITGWAQISYPYGASEKDSLEKLQYDLFYIKNYTLFLDLVIILQTAHEVTWAKGGR
ncbi:MAG: TIGR03013 family PEP-CTERM/XrtA system glycosyltransferase [Gammaproteobacteria bacterium]|nr:TIGR03013 family PEP-CTERM/XrtA system glycosyltransferase [Gammaproteobacteria bacterium]